MSERVVFGRVRRLRLASVAVLLCVLFLGADMTIGGDGGVESPSATLAVGSPSATLAGGAPAPLLSAGGWDEDEFSARWDDFVASRAATISVASSATNWGENFTQRLGSRWKAAGTGLLSAGTLADLARGLEDGKLGPELESLRLRAADSLLRAVGDAALEDVRDPGGFIKRLEIGYQTPLGGRAGSFSADALVALWEDPRYLYYAQLGGIAQDLDPGGNLGLGVRSLALGDRLLLGANVFFDYLNDDEHGVFWRQSWGIEAKSAWGDLSANHYRRLTDPRIKRVGNDLLRVYTAGGWDVEASARLPRLDWLEFGLRRYVWRRLAGEDLRGLRYRLSLSPLSFLTYEIEYDDPEEGGGEVGFGLRFAADFGGDTGLPPFFRKRYSPLSADAKALWARRYERVRRTYEQRIVEELLYQGFAELLAATPSYTPPGGGRTAAAATLSLSLSEAASVALTAQLSFAPGSAAGNSPPPTGYVILPADAAVCAGADRQLCEIAIAAEAAAVTFSLSAGADFRDDIVVALLELEGYEVRSEPVTITSTIQPPALAELAAAQAEIFEGGETEVALGFSRPLATTANARLVFGDGAGAADEDDVALFIGGEPLDCSGGECALTLPAGTSEAPLRVTAVEDDDDDEDRESLILALQARNDLNDDWEANDAGAEIMILDNTRLAYASSAVEVIEGVGLSREQIIVSNLRARATVTMVFVGDGDDPASPADLVLMDVDGNSICGDADNKIDCALVIDAGATRADFMIAAARDTENDENDEAARLALRAPADEGYRVGDPLAVNIRDVRVIALRADSSRVAEGSHLDVEAFGADGVLTVTFSITGTPIFGSDYQLLHGGGTIPLNEGEISLTLSAGGTTPLTITALIDGEDESASNETMRITPQAPMGYVSGGALAVEVVDSNVGVAFAANDLPVTEGGEAGAKIMFDPAANRGAVSFAISSGAAVLGEDYQIVDADGAVVSCSASDPDYICALGAPDSGTELDFTVRALADWEGEVEEVVVLRLRDSGVYLGDDTMNVAIANASVTVNFGASGGTFGGVAGDLAVTMELSQPRPDSGATDAQSVIRFRRSSTVGYAIYSGGGMLSCVGGGVAVCSLTITAGASEAAMTLRALAGATTGEIDLTLLEQGNFAPDGVTVYTAQLAVDDIAIIDSDDDDGDGDSGSESVTEGQSAALRLSGYEGELTITLLAAATNGAIYGAPSDPLMPGDYIITDEGGDEIDCPGGRCVLDVPDGGLVISIAAHADGVLEFTESFTVSVIAPIGYRGGAIPVTINNKPVALSFRDDGLSVAEGEEVVIEIDVDTAPVMGYRFLVTVIRAAGLSADEYGFEYGFAYDILCDDAKIDCSVPIAAYANAATMTLTIGTDWEAESDEEMILRLVEWPGLDEGLRGGVYVGTNEAVTITVQNTKVSVGWTESAGVFGGGSGELAVTVTISEVTPVGEESVIRFSRSDKVGYEIHSGDAELACIDADSDACSLTITASESEATMTLRALAGASNSEIDLTIEEVGNFAPGGDAVYMADLDVDGIAIIDSDNNDRDSDSGTESVAEGQSAALQLSGFSGDLSIDLLAATSEVIYGVDKDYYLANSAGAPIACPDNSVGVPRCDLTLLGGELAISIVAVRDGVIEGSESLRVAVVAPAGYSGGEIEVTIENTDMSLSFDSAAAAVAISEGGSATLTIEIEDVGEFVGDVPAEAAVITFALTDGGVGRLERTEYELSGANCDIENPRQCGISFAANARAATVTISILSDWFAESAELLTLALGDRVGNLADGYAKTDDDKAEITADNVKVAVGFDGLAAGVDGTFGGRAGELAVTVTLDQARPDSGATDAQSEVSFSRPLVAGYEIRSGGAALACIGDDSDTCSLTIAAGASEATMILRATDEAEAREIDLTLLAQGNFAPGGDDVSPPRPIIYTADLVVDDIAIIDSDNDDGVSGSESVAEGQSAALGLSGFSGDLSILSIDLLAAESDGATYGRAADYYLVDSDGDPIDCQGNPDNDGVPRCDLTLSGGELAISIVAVRDGATEENESLRVAVVAPAGYSGGAIDITIENTPMSLSFDSAAAEVAISEGGSATLTIGIEDIGEYVGDVPTAAAVITVGLTVGGVGGLERTEYELSGANCVDNTLRRQCGISFAANARAATVTISILSDWVEDDGELLTLALGDDDGDLADGYAKADGEAVIEAVITAGNVKVAVGFDGLAEGVDGTFGEVVGELAVTVTISEVTPVGEESVIRFNRSDKVGYEIHSGDADLACIDADSDACSLTITAGESEATMTLRAETDASNSEIDLTIEEVGNFAPSEDDDVYRARLMSNEIVIVDPDEDDDEDSGTETVAEGQSAALRLSGFSGDLSIDLLAATNEVIYGRAADYYLADSDGVEIACPEGRCALTLEDGGLDISIVAVRDGAIEGSESLRVAVVAPAGYRGGEIEVTIENTDISLSFGSADVAISEGNEGELEIVADVAPVAAYSVPFVIRDGGSLSSGEYDLPGIVCDGSPLLCAVEIAAGETAAAVTISITSDWVAENAELLTLALGDADGNLVTGYAKATNAEAEITANNAKVAVGWTENAGAFGGGSGELTVTVTISEVTPVGEESVIQFSRSDNRSDESGYEIHSGDDGILGCFVGAGSDMCSLTIAAGDSAATMTLQATDGAETGDIVLTLLEQGNFAPGGDADYIARLAADEIAIIDSDNDDGDSDSGTASVAEGQSAALQLSGFSGDLSIDLLAATSAGATYGSAADYYLADSDGDPIDCEVNGDGHRCALTLPADGLMISIVAVRDGAIEGSESLRVSVVAPPGEDKGGAIDITIENTPISLSFDSAEVAISEGGSATLTIEIEDVGEFVGDVPAAAAVITFALTDGGDGRLERTEYELSGANCDGSNPRQCGVSFAANVQAATVTISILSDWVEDDGEKLTLALGDGVGNLVTGYAKATNAEAEITADNAKVAVGWTESGGTFGRAGELAVTVTLDQARPSGATDGQSEVSFSRPLVAGYEIHSGDGKLGCFDNGSEMCSLTITTNASAATMILRALAGANDERIDLTLSSDAGNFAPDGDAVYRARLAVDDIAIIDNDDQDEDENFGTETVAEGQSAALRLSGYEGTLTIALLEAARNEAVYGASGDYIITDGGGVEIACPGGRCVLEMPSGGVTVISVAARRDGEIEVNESLRVSVVAPVGYSGGEIGVAIENTEMSLSFASAEVEISEGGSATLTIEIEDIGEYVGDVPVSAAMITFALIDDGAADRLERTEYELSGASCDGNDPRQCGISFAANARAATVTISILSDWFAESDELLTLYLGDGIGNLVTGYAKADPPDAQAVITANNAKVSVGWTASAGVFGGGSGELAVTVTLDQPRPDSGATDAQSEVSFSRPLVAGYEIDSGGAALACIGDDSDTCSLTIAAGASEATMILRATDGAETGDIVLTLSSDAGNFAPGEDDAVYTARLAADEIAIIDLDNDDGDSDSGTATVAEGQSAALQLSGFSGDLSIDLLAATSDGATYGSAADYYLVDSDGVEIKCPDNGGGVPSCGLTLPADGLTISIVAVRDGAIEGIESLRVSVVAPPGEDTGGAIDITIENTPISLSFGSAEVAISEGGSATLTIEIEDVGEFVGDVPAAAAVITFALTDGGAGRLERTEYELSGANCDGSNPRQCGISFAANARAATVTISILSDWVEDDGEKLTLALGDGVGNLVTGYAKAADDDEAVITADNAKVAVGWTASRGGFSNRADELAVTLTLSQTRPSGVTDEQSEVSFSRSLVAGYEIHSGGAALACIGDDSDTCSLTIAANASAATMTMTLRALAGASDETIDLTLLSDAGNFAPPTDGMIGGEPAHPTFTAGLVAEFSVLRFTSGFGRVRLGQLGELPLWIDGAFSAAGAANPVTLLVSSPHIDNFNFAAAAVDGGVLEAATPSCTADGCDELALDFVAGVVDGVPILIDDLTFLTAPADLEFVLQESAFYDRGAVTEFTLRFNHDAEFGEQAGAGVAEGDVLRGTISFDPALAQTTLTVEVRREGDLSLDDFNLSQVVGASQTEAVCEPASDVGDAALIGRCEMTTPSDPVGEVVFEIAAADDTAEESGEALILSLAESRYYEMADIDDNGAIGDELRVGFFDDAGIGLRDDERRLAADESRRAAADWITITPGAVDSPDAPAILRRVSGDAVINTDYWLIDGATDTRLVCDSALGEADECGLALHHFSAGNLFVRANAAAVGKSAVLALTDTADYNLAEVGMLTITIVPFAELAGEEITLSGFESAAITITTSAEAAADLTLTLAVVGGDGDNFAIRPSDDYVTDPATLAYNCTDESDDGDEWRCPVTLDAGATVTVVHLFAPAHWAAPVTTSATVRLADGGDYIVDEIDDNRVTLQLEDGIAASFHSASSRAVTVGQLISIVVTPDVLAYAADKEVEVRFAPTKWAPLESAPEGGRPAEKYTFGLMEFVTDIPVLPQAPGSMLPEETLSLRLVTDPLDDDTAASERGYDLITHGDCDIGVSANASGHRSYPCPFYPVYPFTSGDSRLTLNLATLPDWPTNEITVALRPNEAGAVNAVSPSATLPTAVVFAAEKSTIAFTAAETRLEGSSAQFTGFLRITIARGEEGNAGALVDGTVAIDAPRYVAEEDGGSFVFYSFTNNAVESSCDDPDPATGRRICEAAFAAGDTEISIRINFNVTGQPEREFEFGLEAPTSTFYEVGAPSRTRLIAPAGASMLSFPETERFIRINASDLNAFGRARVKVTVTLNADGPLQLASSFSLTISEVGQGAALAALYGTPNARTGWLAGDAASECEGGGGICAAQQVPNGPAVGAIQFNSYVGDFFEVAPLDAAPLENSEFRISAANTLTVRLVMAAGFDLPDATPQISEGMAVGVTLTWSAPLPVYGTNRTPYQTTFNNYPSFSFLINRAPSARAPSTDTAVAFEDVDLSTPTFTRLLGCEDIPAELAAIHADFFGGALCRANLWRIRNDSFLNTGKILPLTVHAIADGERDGAEEIKVRVIRERSASHLATPYYLPDDDVVEATVRIAETTSQLRMTPTGEREVLFPARQRAATVTVTVLLDSAFESGDRVSLDFGEGFRTEQLGRGLVLNWRYNSEVTAIDCEGIKSLPPDPKGPRAILRKPTRCGFTPPDGADSFIVPILYYIGGARPSRTVLSVGLSDNSVAAVGQFALPADPAERSFTATEDGDIRLWMTPHGNLDIAIQDLEDLQAPRDLVLTIHSDHPFAAGDQIGLQMAASYPRYAVKYVNYLGHTNLESKPSCFGDVGEPIVFEAQCQLSPNPGVKQIAITMQYAVHEDVFTEERPDHVVLDIKISDIEGVAETSDVFVYPDQNTLRVSAIPEAGFIVLPDQLPPPGASASALRDTSAQVYVPADEANPIFAQITLSAPRGTETTVTVRVSSSVCGDGCSWTAHGGTDPEGGARPFSSNDEQFEVPLPAGLQTVSLAITAAPAGSRHVLELLPGADARIAVDSAAARLTVAAVDPDPTFSLIRPIRARDGQAPSPETTARYGLLLGGITGQPVWLRSSTPLAARPVTMYLWPTHIGDSSDESIAAGSARGEVLSRLFPNGLHWHMSKEVDAAHTGPVSGVWPAQTSLTIVKAISEDDLSRTNEMWQFVFTPLPGEREIQFDFGIFPPVYAANQDGISHSGVDDEGDLDRYELYYTGVRRLSFSTVPYPFVSFVEDGLQHRLIIEYKKFHRPDTGVRVEGYWCIPQSTNRPACMNVHPDTRFFDPDPGDDDPDGFLAPCPVVLGAPPQDPAPSTHYLGFYHCNSEDALRGNGSVPE